MVAVLVSAACGRVSFGELSDAGGALDDGALDDVLTDGPGADVLLGHDEDGDGVPDASDPCPHLPETTQSDLDGDLVGDSCDREPSVANQQWQLFHPLTTGSGTGFTRSGSWTVNADDWSFVDQTNPNQLIRSGFAVTDIDVWVGVTFEALAAGGRQGAIIVHSGAASPYYYGELFEFGSARVNLMEYDGTNYTAIDTAIIGGTFPLGYTTLHLRVSTMPSQEFLLQADTPVGPAAVNFATPNYTGAQNTIIGFGNTTGRLHYIAIVATN